MSSVTTTAAARTGALRNGSKPGRPDLAWRAEGRVQVGLDGATQQRRLREIAARVMASIAAFAA
jgi:hypothetical protein